MLLLLASNALSLPLGLTSGFAAQATPAPSDAQGATQNEAPRAAPARIAQYPGAPYEDREGNLWITTVLEGLIRYDGAEWVTFTTEDGLAGNLLRDFVEDEDGLFWMATNGGLCTFDGEEFVTVADYGDHAITRTFNEAGDHLDLWDLHFDRTGQLWIATMDGVFRLEEGVFVPFELPRQGTKPNYEFGPKMVYEIYEDRAGHLWFGTDGAGLVRYDGTTQTLYTKEQHGLCSDRICALLEDSRGDFWFGSSGGGVSRFDGETFTTHLRSETFSKHTGWGRTMGILEDTNGHVWFGNSSAGGGAYRFDGEAFRYFSEAEGLGTGGVPSLRLDRSGRLWLGTTSGIFRLEGERFVPFP